MKYTFTKTLHTFVGTHKHTVYKTLMTLTTSYTTIIRLTLLLLITNIFTFQTLYSQTSQKYVFNTSDLLKMNPDRAFVILEKQRNNALNNKDTVLLVKSLISISIIDRTNLNYNSAFENAGEAVYLSKEIKDTLLLAKAHGESGLLYNIFNQDEETSKHLYKSCHYYKLAYKQQLITSEQLIRPYFDLIISNTRIRNYQLAHAYLDTCYAIADTIKLNESDHFHLLEKEATLLHKNNRSLEAIRLLKSNEKRLEKINTPATYNLSELHCKAVIYTTIANISLSIKDYQVAKQYYEKAISNTNTLGATIHKGHLYGQYSNVLSNLGEHRLAYDNLKKSKSIFDKIFSARSNENRGLLTIKDRYTEALKKQQLELNEKNFELAQKKQEILRFRIILYVSVFLSIIIALIIRGRISTLKHQKENTINEKRQQESEGLLEVKNKELTATMLQLIEKEEIIKTLSSKLEKTSNNKALLISINKNSASLWDNFNSRFMLLNEGFYERLKEAIPDLSASDLKVCALIKLNFSGKEMSQLLGISIGSVHMARHRLRKKIELERSTNLSSFINTI